MGALKINCCCHEVQMENIVNYVIESLNASDRWSLADIDEDIEGLRVSVRFEAVLDIVRLKSAEVMDAYWDILFEDSAVLTSRLQSLLEDYNTRNREAIGQSREIRSDQLSEFGLIRL